MSRKKTRDNFLLPIISPRCSRGASAAVFDTNAMTFCSLFPLSLSLSLYEAETEAIIRSRGPELESTPRRKTFDELGVVVELLQGL